MSTPNGLNPKFQGDIGSNVGQALTAGGALLFTLGTFHIYGGSGVPTISATAGDLYLRSDGSSVSTRMYINAGTTTWIAVTTAS